MHDFWIGFGFGLLVGGCLGALTMALLSAASAADAHIERMAQQRDGEHDA